MNKEKNIMHGTLLVLRANGTDYQPDFDELSDIAIGHGLDYIEEFDKDGYEYELESIGTLVEELVRDGENITIKGIGKTVHEAEKEAHTETVFASYRWFYYRKWLTPVIYHDTFFDSMYEFVPWLELMKESQDVELVGMYDFHR